MVKASPYLPPLHSTQQWHDINKEATDVVDRESDVNSITDTIQTSVTSNQESRSVSFEEQADAQQIPDPEQADAQQIPDSEDAMPSLKPYLEQEAPELAEASSPSRNAEATNNLPFQRRPRTHKFT